VNITYSASLIRTITMEYTLYIHTVSKKILHKLFRSELRKVP